MAENRAFSFEPTKSIGYLIRDTSRLILARLQTRIEPYDVTLGQYFILRELWENEGLSQRELSARISIQEPSTVAALDAMEKRDLVVRVRSKHDRRKIHIYLSARGRGLRTELLDHAAAIINDGTADFSQGDLETLRRLLLALKANLEAPN
ncbi:MAG: hypothetical protein NVSMB5_02740 [Candidatus Velthaea sp.]